MCRKIEEIQSYWISYVLHIKGSTLFYLYFFVCVRECVCVRCLFFFSLWITFLFRNSKHFEFTYKFSGIMYCVSLHVYNPASSAISIYWESHTCWSRKVRMVTKTITIWDDTQKMCRPLQSKIASRAAYGMANQVNTRLGKHWPLPRLNPWANTGQQIHIRGTHTPETDTGIYTLLLLLYATARTMTNMCPYVNISTLKDLHTSACACYVICRQRLAAITIGST